jgi:murein DD-endopeptidase MepM/ murein hydrolase activator NlpD
MSCCPSVPPSAAIGGAFTEANGPETVIQQGESVECYMVRGGNTTGRHDDATANVNNQIENASIPISRTNSVASFNNVQFRLTNGSTRTPTSWAMVNNGGEPLATLGVTLTIGGLLNGPILAGALGKKFRVRVSASDGMGVIDDRGYTFSPSIGDGGTEIRLVSPLPGGIVNSKFGPRLHPIQNVMKPHQGIDMKMADRSVKDVVAAADGEVILAGGNSTSGYGIRVHVKHDTGTGQHLCTTTYNHLSKVYVAVGQKVIAGQKLGLEGSTGASTGNHLHFECKLPDGKFIDPEPLINGSLQVARSTLTNGDADPGSIETKNSTASLAREEVEARQDSCAAFGPGYP